MIQSPWSHLFLGKMKATALCCVWTILAAHALPLESCLGQPAVFFIRLMFSIWDFSRPPYILLQKQLAHWTILVLLFVDAALDQHLSRNILGHPPSCTGRMLILLETHTGELWKPKTGSVRPEWLVLVSRKKLYPGTCSEKSGKRIKFYLFWTNWQTILKCPTWDTSKELEIQKGNKMY